MKNPACESSSARDRCEVSKCVSKACASREVSPPPGGAGAAAEQPRVSQPRSRRWVCASTAAAAEGRAGSPSGRRAIGRPCRVTGVNDGQSIAPRGPVHARSYRRCQIRCQDPLTGAQVEQVVSGKTVFLHNTILLLTSVFWRLVWFGGFHGFHDFSAALFAVRKPLFRVQKRSFPFALPPTFCTRLKRRLILTTAFFRQTTELCAFFEKLNILLQ